MITVKKKTVKVAAIMALEREGKPLHYREITRRILKECNLTGKTPEQTVGSTLGTNDRFKRVAEGVYALAEWKDYPEARFAKHIAYDVLRDAQGPIKLQDLGVRIIEERHFLGSPRQVAKSAVRNNKLFIYYEESDTVALDEWHAE